MIIRAATWLFSATTFLFNNLKFDHRNPSSCLSALWNTAFKRESLLCRPVVCMCVCVCVCETAWKGAGGGFLVACMDRSVIQRAHTVSIVEPSVVPIRSGWGGKGASWIKTRAANRKWACKDKMRTAWPSVYEWHLVIFPLFFFNPQIAFFFLLVFWFILIELFGLLGFNSGCRSTHVHTAQEWAILEM